MITLVPFRVVVGIVASLIAWALWGDIAAVIVALVMLFALTR